MQNTLNQYPPSSVNNSRAIIRSALVSMQSRPSESKANTLEHKYGIVSDFKDLDLGNEGRNSKVYDVTDQFSQEQIEQMINNKIF
jgi:hypothetical protein